MNEDVILNDIVIEQELARLKPWDADMVRLLYRLEPPLDYPGPWPPKITDIAVFIGTKYNGRPLHEATIRYRHRKIKRKWMRRLA